MAFRLSLECLAWVHEVDEGGHFCRGGSMSALQVGKTLMRLRTLESFSVQLDSFCTVLPCRVQLPLASGQMPPLPHTLGKLCCAQAVQLARADLHVCVTQLVVQLVVLLSLGHSHPNRE